jgi:hypothetical protein
LSLFSGLKRFPNRQKKWINLRSVYNKPHIPETDYCSPNKHAIQTKKNWSIKRKVFNKNCAHNFFDISKIRPYALSGPGVKIVAIMPNKKASRTEIRIVMPGDIKRKLITK